MSFRNINIGNLDNEIYFIQPIISNGESNEDKIDGWELIDSYPLVTARRYDTKGDTSVVNDRLTYSQNTEWTIRYREDLNVRMRLVYNTQVYEILSITDFNELRKRYLRIYTNLLDETFFT